jgi:hypothetical protein
MSELTYDGSLKGLLAILDRCRDNPRTGLPDRIRRASPLAAPLGMFSVQPELWGNTPEPRPDETGLPGKPSAGGGLLPDTVCLADVIMNPQGSAAWAALSEVSVAGCEHFLNGWMSELPIEAELIRFAWNILAAAESAAGGIKGDAGRREAEKVVTDRCDTAAGIVLDASWKVWKETDRLFGLLRFFPSPAGIHIACCTPDHFVLPALADHFALRFGTGTPWMIIDERRDIALCRMPGGEPLLIHMHEQELLPEPSLSGPDPWEDLWCNYHQTINNENRSNPGLQRQFMPRRYWKYLPEMQ